MPEMLKSKIRAGKVGSSVLVALALMGCVGGGAPADPYDIGRKPDVIANAGAGSIAGPMPAAGRQKAESLGFALPPAVWCCVARRAIKPSDLLSFL
jgi:hypothetical protein